MIQRNYNGTKDLELIYEFLGETYEAYRHVNNWEVARWSFNRYCIHSDEELSGNRDWTKSIQIWEEDGNIIGVSHCEEAGDYFLQVHPSHTGILEEMMLATFKRCRELNPEQKTLSFSTLTEDTERIKLFKEHGGCRLDFLDDNRTLVIAEFAKDYENHKGHKSEPLVIPSGYSIRNIDTADPTCCQKVADLYRKVWPESMYISDKETVMNFSDSAAFHEDRTFILEDSAGSYLAFLILWSDKRERNAHLYPFAVDEFSVHSHAVEILLQAAVIRLYEMNYKTLTLGAWYEDNKEALFEGIGFTKKAPCASYQFNLQTEYSEEGERRTS